MEGCGWLLHSFGGLTRIPGGGKKQIPSLRYGMTSRGALRNDKQGALRNDKQGKAEADSFAALRNDKQGAHGASVVDRSMRHPAFVGRQGNAGILSLPLRQAQGQGQNDNLEGAEATLSERRWECWSRWAAAAARRRRARC